MPAVKRNLEQRITTLERKLRKVQTQLKEVRQASRRPWWEQLAGRFKDDPLFDEIMEVGQKYRRSLTPLAR